MLTRNWSLLIVLGTLAACGGGSDSAPAAQSPGAAAPPAATPPPAASATAPAAATTLPRTPSPPGAMAYIISPADGAVVSSPVRVVFGLKGFGVVPAGTAHPNAGHHHLLIDTGLPPLSSSIPADANHVHFGKGQTETEIELSPGRHELRLLVGDYVHVPHDPPIVSEPITITVQ
jgi:hypothetical protein